ncbi:MAG: hypothetical protein K2K39_03425 [Clostridia bacterium]|nr:hypothetical protein [Clostridia bacterium]
MAHKVKTDEIAAADRAAYALERKNKAKKLTVVLTYLFALTCLLAGLLVPLYGYVEGGDLQSMMLLRHLPRMVNNIVAIIPAEPLKNGLIPSTIPWFGDVMTTTYSFDIFSLFSVLYALLCLFAIVMLLPVCLGKKEKNTSAGCAFFIEVLGLLLTLAYAAAVFYYAFVLYIEADMSGSLIWNQYNFLIPMGGLLIAAVLQSIATKGGIGISKTLGFVLALAGVFVLFDLAMIIPASSGNLDHFSSFLKAGDKRAFVTVDGKPVLGFYGIVMLIDIVNTIETIVTMATSGTNGIFSVIILVLLVFTSLMVLFNLFCDTIGLGTGKKFKKDRSPAKNGASNGFALARYVVTLVLGFLLFVMVLINILVIENRADAAVPGIYLYALIVIVVLQLVNAAFRTAVANRRYKKGKLAPAATTQEVMVIEDPAFANAEPEPVYATPVEATQVEAEPVAYAEPATYEEQPAPVYEAQPVNEEVEPAYTEYAQPEPEPAYEPEPVVYAEPLYEPAEPQPAEPKVNTVYIYSGDTDEFLDTLTDKEKYEFVDVFLKKSQGSVSGVPEYRINEDNSDFFPAVFVHINRYRNVVSDALMTKMYKQLGKM